MEIKRIKVAFSDDRGTIADIFYKSNIEHVAIIKTNDKGRIIRGNHYHKQTTQHIYMTKGNLIYWYRNQDDNSPVKHIKVEEGFMVSTPPLEIHALECFGPSEFIVFSTGLRGGIDYEADTFRDKIILK